MLLATEKVWTCSVLSPRSSIVSYLYFISSIHKNSQTRNLKNFIGKLTELPGLVNSFVCLYKDGCHIVVHGQEAVGVVSDWMSDIVLHGVEKCTVGAAHLPVVGALPQVRRHLVKTIQRKDIGPSSLIYCHKRLPN